MCVICGETWPRLLEAPTRADDPVESHEAAASIDMRGHHRIVLAIIQLGEPLSLEMIVAATRGRLSPSGARTRTAELREMGLVERAGTGRTVSGRSCALWRLSAGGRAAAPVLVADTRPRLT